MKITAAMIRTGRFKIVKRKRLIHDGKTPTHTGLFELLWKMAKGPDLEKERVFAPPRRWRFDYTHIESRIAIELDGGVWKQGRHTRGSGYVKDCEKFNTATLHGWGVFRLTPEMVTMKNIEGIVEHINRVIEKLRQ